MTQEISKPVVVICAGAHATVLITILRRLGATILGATDANTLRHGKSLMGVPILGDDTVLEKHAHNSVLLVNGLGTVGTTKFRRAIFDRFVARGYRFATIVDPLAILAGAVEIGEGAQILAGAVIQVGARIGSDAIINIGVTIDHDCQIGAHAHLTPGVTLSGNVRIGDGVHIGTGASVIHNIRIGAGSIVGAGAVVTKDISEGVIAFGVPAKIIKHIE